MIPDPKQSSEMESIMAIVRIAFDFTTHSGTTVNGHFEMNTYTADDLVLCQSADGFSLHAPGSTDEEIANGDAPYLVSGPGKPTDADYERALKILSERLR